MARHRLTACKKWRRLPPFFVSVEVRLSLSSACSGVSVILYSGYNPDADELTNFQVLSGLNYSIRLEPGLPLYYRLYGANVAYIEVATHLAS